MTIEVKKQGTVWVVVLAGQVMGSYASKGEAVKQAQKVASQNPNVKFK